MGNITQEDVDQYIHESDGAIKCSNCDEVIVPKEELSHLRELERRGDPNAMNAGMGISNYVEKHLVDCLYEK